MNVGCCYKKTQNPWPSRCEQHKKSPESWGRKKSYKTGSTFLLLPPPQSDTHSFPRLSSSSVSLLAFVFLQTCLRCSALFEQHEASSVRHSASHLSLQVSMVYKVLQHKNTSSWAAEWELMFKWSRRREKKPTKKPIKSSWSPLSYIKYKTHLNRNFVIKRELKCFNLFPQYPFHNLYRHS